MHPHLSRWPLLRNTQSVLKSRVSVIVLCGIIGEPPHSRQPGPGRAPQHSPLATAFACRPASATHRAARKIQWRAPHTFAGATSAMPSPLARLIARPQLPPPPPPPPSLAAAAARRRVS
mmetsp:Transcript_58104/g.159491  ORF Transcript_58104/g.159491 Transcript_58104/m.159491 type:complete len:119 (+) Transcript_58104:67-423(+)